MGLAIGCQSRSGPVPRYNVLLVSLDTVRQDFLGCYGHRPRRAPDADVSPNLDALARQGVRMQDAYASSSWTLPSHLSMMTGQTPVVHSVDTDLQAFGGPQSTLAEVLRRHGYRTAGVFSGPLLEPLWGFGRGFERYRRAYGPDAMRFAERHDADPTPPGEDEREARDVWLRDVSSPRVTATALEELRELARQPAPWFLFVHYFDAHNDYLPPPPYDTRFDPGYAGPISGTRVLADPLLSVRASDDDDEFVRRASDRDLDHLVALYEGEIAWVDAHVGKLLAELDALAVTGRTLVIVVSDHGEEFFEHGGLGHRRTLFEEVLRIPLLLRLPGVLPAGKVVPGPVSTADLMPTVLDLLDLPERQAWSGSRSFVPLIDGADDPQQRNVLSRLVRFRTGTATVDDGTQVPERRVTVSEVFRQGPIKLSRVRTWPQFATTAAVAVRARLEASAEREYRSEHLTWIDVERFRSEPAADQSSSFDAPAARAALADFQARYRELLALRQPAASAHVAPHVGSALRALGYVGAGELAAGMDLGIPVPGEEPAGG